MKYSIEILFTRGIKIIAIAALTACTYNSTFAQDPAKEEDFFRVINVSVPEGVILEVGGLTTLPNGGLGVSTRRGDIYIIENPASQRPFFRKFASGLHEVLGLAYKNGALYCAQRSELTKVMDTNMDGKADLFETIYAWPLSGNFHEYSFGPKLAPDGSFFVTLNTAFLQDWWHTKSVVPWRGWALRIQEDGSYEPWAAGLRSPCGISIIDGDLFYTDNQGDWVASGSIMHLKKGAFAGHPASLNWTTLPNSPLKLTAEKIFSNVSPRLEFEKDGSPVQPQNILNEKFMTVADMKKYVSELQLPSVWLPHGILGVSSSEIVKIPQGTFGPFAGQLLVGDQGQSSISRVFLEKVNGEYQGGAWMFRSGFQSGVVRLEWAKDGSLFVGETNRGWGSAGEATEGLQRLVWNNKIPFEMRTIHAKPDGFEIEFTKPLNKKYAEDISSYSVESFTYKYQAVYGSPPVNSLKHLIKGVKVSADGLKARIVVDKLRKYYIHTITLNGIRDNENIYSLLHPTVYYTLNNIPEGQKLPLSEVSTKNSAKAKKASKPLTSLKGSTKLESVVDPASKILATPKTPNYKAVEPLLVKYTCSSCHSQSKKQIGPSFDDVAKRKYSIDKILNLVYNPQPKNWPNFTVAMPPMTQVPQKDMRKIAEWIKSLER